MGIYRLAGGAFGVGAVREPTKEELAECATATIYDRAQRLQDTVMQRNDLAAFLRELFEEEQHRMRGTTHWVGCEEVHPRCARARKIKAALGGSNE